MAIRSKVNTSGGLVNIASVANNGLLENFTNDPQELKPIRQGGNFNSDDVFTLLKQLIENDENLFANNANLSLLFSEGILPKNDTTQHLNASNTTTTFTVGIGRLIINENFVNVSSPITITIGAGGWNTVTAGQYRADLIEIDTAGNLSLTLGTPTLVKPFLKTKLDRTDPNKYPVYTIMVHNPGAGTVISHYQKIADFAGFDELRKDAHVLTSKNDTYPNVFETIYADTRHSKDQLDEYLSRLAGQSSTASVLLETDANFPPEPVDPLLNAPPNNRGLRHIPSGVWNADSTSQPSYPDFVYPGENFKTNGFLYLPIIHGGSPTDTVATIKNFKLGVRYDVVGDVAGVANEGLEVNFVKYPQFLFTGDDPLTYNLNVNSATSTSITVNNTNTLNLTNLTLDNLATNQIIAPGDFVLVSAGTGKGQTGKITSVTAQTINLGVTFTTVLDNTSKIVIFKNNGGTSVGNIAWTSAQINADIATNNTYGSITQGGYAADPIADADADRFIKIKKTGISINITKEKYYFMLVRVVREGLVLSDAPKIHIDQNTTTYSDTNVCNIYHVAEYAPPTGLYPVVDGGNDVFRLFDQYGDLAATFSQRNLIYPGLTEWTLVDKDLNDYELANINYSVDIPFGEAWVDATLNRVAFNPTSRPESLYITTYLTRYNSNKLNSKEIKKIGQINQSIEDWMSDKFPDNKNSGLMYIKKQIAASGDIIVPGGYVAIAFDDSTLVNNIILEEDAELLLMPKRVPSFIQFVMSGLAVGWNENFTVGAGTLQYPQYKTYTNNGNVNEIIRLTYSYNNDGSYSNILIEYSTNAGATYSYIATKNFAYNSGYLISANWT